VERLTQSFCTLSRIRITNLTFSRCKIAGVRIAIFWGMTPCSLVDKCQILGGFKSVEPPRSQWPTRQHYLLLIFSNVKVSTKFYKVNRILPVILFTYRTQLDLSALCLCFSPPNQEKNATLFLRTCCFYPADGTDKLSWNIGTKYQPTSRSIRDERKPQACTVCASWVNFR
jgi:hypothetical protein